MLHRIFLNYRWADSADATGRIYDWLVREFPPENIFYDQLNIDYGDDIPDRITSGLEGANILLVVIGPQWLELLRKRMESKATDWVSREIATALQNNKVRVVPVLLPKTEKPHADFLPDDLKALYQREEFKIPEQKEWGVYLDILLKKLNHWTFSDEPFFALGHALKTRYTTERIFTEIPISIQDGAVPMDSYFITPSSIDLKVARHRDDLFHKETENSILKMNRRRQQLQNFIHQDYISLRLLDTDQNVLILGNPGTGKSTFARWLCHQWTKNPDDHKALPFYVSLRELTFAEGKPDLLAYITGSLGQYNESQVKMMLDAAAPDVLWVLDGFDELSSKKKQTLHHALQQLSNQVRYVLLSRPYGMLDNVPFRFDYGMQLDGFSYGQIVQYIQRFLALQGKEASQAHFLDILRNNKVLEDYAHNPMMLSFIAGIFLREAKPEQALGTIDSQYQLQEKVFAWILDREQEKVLDRTLDTPFYEDAKEREQLAYDMQIHQEFIRTGTLRGGIWEKAARSLNDMGLGRMDKDGERWQFSFNSVTFQEFLAAKHLGKSISIDAFNMLIRTRTFWNFTKMLIGCLGAEQRGAQAETLLRGLLKQYEEGGTKANHFLFYHFATKLSECPHYIVRQLMSDGHWMQLYQLFVMNGAYSEVWQSLLMEAIRKLYHKVRPHQRGQLKTWILEGISPLPEGKRASEGDDTFSVSDGVKLLAQQLDLYRDEGFMGELVAILQSIAPKMDAEEEFDIYFYEPLAFVLDEALDRCEDEMLEQLKHQLWPLLNELPNEFIGVATRLKARMVQEGNLKMWQAQLNELEILLGKTSKPSKHAQNKLFEKLKALTENLHFLGKGQGMADAVPDVVSYFQVAGRIASISEIDDYDLEEIFQLSTESVSGLQNDAVYEAVFQFALTVQPDYSGVVFADSEHLFHWYERRLQEARADELQFFVTALTQTDGLQARFVKVRQTFCDLLMKYALMNEEVLRVQVGSFTEVRFEEAEESPVQSIIRPLEKLIYFGRDEDTTWGEADKLALVDMALQAPIRQWAYFDRVFLPGLMGTKFNLYRAEHWAFVIDCCQTERLPSLFALLRNPQLYSFASNLPYLASVADFLIRNVNAPHVQERPFLIIEFSTRCLRLIYRHRFTKDLVEAADTLTEKVHQLLLTPVVRDGFQREECIGALEGRDAAAFVLCYYLTKDEQLCSVREYDSIFGNQHRDRKLFIEGLIEFFSSNDGLDTTGLRELYPFLGSIMADKLNHYIDINEWEFSFDRESFEQYLKVS